MSAADGLHLLTFHGTVVCCDAEGRLVHRPLIAGPGAPPPATWRYCGGERLVSSPAGDGGAGPHAMPSSGFLVRPTAAARGRVHLQRASGYLRATPDGMLDCDVDLPQGWEEFRIISAADLGLLAHLLGHSWIIARTHTVVPAAEVHLLPEFRLRIGPLTADFSAGMPAVAEGAGAVPNRLLLFSEGWKIEELRLFRPLVYFTVFCRHPDHRQYLRMAVLSIRSFVLFHGPLAEFLLLTNMDREAVLAEVPGDLRARVHVAGSDVPATNIVDIFAQRYRIAGWDRAADYQPLLYVDTDILFNADISRALGRIALSPSIMVGEESWNPLRESESVGAKLFAADPFESPMTLGFNSGTIGIPNIADHRLHLRAIAEVIERYATLHGRASLHWFDQACANYVAAKIGGFDGRTLTPLIEHVGSSEAKPPSRTGIVHFWGLPDKVAAMEAFLAEFRAAAALSPTPRA